MLLTGGFRVTSSRRQHLTCGSSGSVSLTCGARSTVNVDQSTVNTGRVSTGPGQGWIWAGLGPPRGMLWRCHVMALGLYWAMVHGSRSTVNASADPRWTASPFGGPRPPFSSLSVVHVHRVYEWAVQGRNFPSSLVVCSRRWRVSPVSLTEGAGARLTWVEAPPSLGGHGGGI